MSALRIDTLVPHPSFLRSLSVISGQRRVSSSPSLIRKQNRRSLSRIRQNVTSDLRIERLSSCSLPTSKQRKLFSNRLQTFQRRSRVLVACLLLLRSFSTEEAYPFLVSEQRKVSPSLRLPCSRNAEDVSSSLQSEKGEEFYNSYKVQSKQAQVLKPKESLETLQKS